MVFWSELVSTSLHNIIRKDKNGNFRIKRMLKRSIPALIFFEVLRIMCSTAQNVIISKSNTFSDFVGIKIFIFDLFIKELSVIKMS